jgi:hypothetical protein
MRGKLPCEFRRGSRRPGHAAELPRSSRAANLRRYNSNRGLLWTPQKSVCDPIRPIVFEVAGTDEEGGLPQRLDPRNSAPELLKTKFFHNAEVLAKCLLGPEGSVSCRLYIAETGPRRCRDAVHRPGGVDCAEVSIWMPRPPGSHKWDGSAAPLAIGRRSDPCAGMPHRL